MEGRKQALSDGGNERREASGLRPELQDRQSFKGEEVARGEEGQMEKQTRARYRSVEGMKSISAQETGREFWRHLS